MDQWFSWVRGNFKKLSRKDRILLISEIGLGVCALLFLIILIRIFLF